MYYTYSFQAWFHRAGSREEQRKTRLRRNGAYSSSKAEFVRPAFEGNCDFQKNHNFLEKNYSAPYLGNWSSVILQPRKKSRESLRSFKKNTKISIFLTDFKTKRKWKYQRFLQDVHLIVWSTTTGEKSFQ